MPPSLQDKNRKLRPLYDIPYMFEAREFLRKKLIGKKVQRGRGDGGEVLARPRRGWVRARGRECPRAAGVLTGDVELRGAPEAGAPCELAAAGCRGLGADGERCVPGSVFPVVSPAYFSGLV